MKKLQELMNKPFIRNVMIVVTGTAAAQAITLIFAPIITRIYGPEAYGVLGVFMAAINIVAPIAALTYPIAIVLPKEDREAITIGKISFYIAIIISLLTLLFLLLFQDWLVTLLQIEVIAPFLYLMPLVILFSALMQIIEQWLIRKKLFKITAKVTFLQALILNSSKVAGGLISPTAVILVILAALGNGLKAFMLYYNAAKVDITLKNNLFNFERDFVYIKKIIRKYNDFPIFRSPQVFINSISQNLPIIILTVFFGPAAAGFYSIGRTVLSLPSQLIGKAVGDVFYPRISDAANNGENLTKLIIKATLGLSIVGILPFGLIILFGPWIFGLVFGAEWYTAGQYAQWIALWSYFLFINQPTIKALPVLSAQAFHLKFTVINLIIRSSAIVVGYYLFQDDLITVAFFSVAGSLLNILLILLTLKISYKYDKQ